MAGSIWGKAFRISTFGESHGVAVGVVIDGCPAGLPIDVADIQKELDRRRPGQSHITTQRKESDTVTILSGVFEGKTMGTPIALLVYNEDQKPKDYSHLRDKYRPSHADFTYQAKYGTRDYRGGGRSSARETVARVAAGAVAKALLAHHGIQVFAWVHAVGPIHLEQPVEALDLSLTESNIVRCPDPAKAAEMIAYIEGIRKQGDTVGGIIGGIVKHCPAGLGEPVFDKLHADLGKAMLSINAAKGFEYGSGFAGTLLKGSEHNDIFEQQGDKVSTRTNHSGGIQGGISNGMDIDFKVAFKPIATIMRDQEGINQQGESVTIEGKGRHDPCVLPRAVPIVEAMAALVIADHFLNAKLAKLDA
ncbi:MAG: chorismate synthase [Chitinophagales bacterium]|nr:chorismate synthase [Chitinophagales bacterium]